MRKVLLDVMLDNRYVCQLNYDRHGYPELIDGEIIEVFKEDEIRSFIEEKRPSLKGKDFKVSFTNDKRFA